MRHLIVPLDNVPSMAGGREAIRTSVVEVGYSPSGTRRLDRRRVASPKCGKLSVSRLPTNQTLPPYRAQQWSSNRGRTIEGSGNPAQKYYMRQPKQNELFFGPKYKRIEKPLITNDDVCEDNKINTALPGRHQKLVTRQGQRIYFEDSIKSKLYTVRASSLVINISFIQVDTRKDSSFTIISIIVRWIEMEICQKMVTGHFTENCIAVRSYHHKVA